MGKNWLFSSEFRTCINDNEPEAEQVGGSFTPVKNFADSANVVFAGVSIKQFPKDADQGLIIEFLCRNGLPEDKTDAVTIKPNGTVIIKNLDNDTSKMLMDAIHGKAQRNVLAISEQKTPT